MKLNIKLGKSIVQVPDTGTRVLDNTRPFLCSSIVSFWITLACSKERKYHIFGQYWYTKNVPVLTNTGTFQYLGPEVYFFLKLFNVQAMQGRYIWSSLPLNFFLSFFLSLRVNLQCKPLFSKQACPLLTKIMFIIFTSWYDIKGELHPQPKISIFSALSQNYHLLSKLSKELKNGIEILVGQIVFKLWIKTVKILLW